MFLVVVVSLMLLSVSVVHVLWLVAETSLGFVDHQEPHNLIDYIQNRISPAPVLKDRFGGHCKVVPWREYVAV